MADEISMVVNECQHNSEVYLARHGVHGAALCDDKSILLFCDDIGGHKAIDKIFGRCLLENMLTDGRVIITSGRISSNIKQSGQKGYTYNKYLRRLIWESGLLIR